MQKAAQIMQHAKQYYSFSLLKVVAMYLRD